MAARSGSCLVVSPWESSLGSAQLWASTQLRPRSNSQRFAAHCAQGDRVPELAFPSSSTRWASRFLFHYRLAAIKGPHGSGIGTCRRQPSSWLCVCISSRHGQVWYQHVVGYSWRGVWWRNWWYDHLWQCARNLHTHRPSCTKPRMGFVEARPLYV